MPREPAGSRHPDKLSELPWGCCGQRGRGLVDPGVLHTPEVQLVSVGSPPASVPVQSALGRSGTEGAGSLGIRSGQLAPAQSSQSFNPAAAQRLGRCRRCCLRGCRRRAAEGREQEGKGTNPKPLIRDLGGGWGIGDDTHRAWNTLTHTLTSKRWEERAHRHAAAHMGLSPW